MENYLFASLRSDNEANKLSWIMIKPEPFSTRRYLQYLWLRAVHYRRIIDFIGITEGSRDYQYIRKACGEEYSKMCSTMPVLLKENGFDMVFRNIIISPLYYEKIFNILKHRKDPVMLRRINETIKGSVIYLFIKVALLWLLKLSRHIKTKVFTILWRIRRHNNGVDMGTIRNMVKDIDFNCIVMSNKFVKIFLPLQSEIYQNLCRYGLKPLFVLFSNRYSEERMDSGYMVEIPFQFSIFPRYSRKGKSLLREAIRWISDLDISWEIRRQIISDIRNNFLQYMYLQEIAVEILGTGKAKCILTFAENQIDYRVFLCQAKKLNLPTLLYHSVDGIHLLTYEKYYSDIVMVCNKIQLQNFINLGYPPQRCNVVGSFNFSQLGLRPAKTLLDGTQKLFNILYFTKGTKSIDEGILDELIEKLKSLNIDYRIVIKKHPKDSTSFRHFKNMRVFITDKIDYMGFVEESDLIVSQYSGVARRVIPLRKPIILYTYSDILEYGERAFFQNAQLPNYLKYVQNKHEFHDAIEHLLNRREPEPLPQKLAEDLYGYMDANCGNRIAKILDSFVNRQQHNNG